MSAQAAASATQSTVSKPATSSTNAPEVDVSVGKAIAPTVKALPKNSTLKATVVINGKTISLGSLKTNANGSVTLSAFAASKPGTYLIQLTTSKGVKYFVKVVVKAKK